MESERQRGLWMLVLHVCVFLPSHFSGPVTSNIPPSSLRNYFHHKSRKFVSFSIKFFPQSLVVSCSCFKDSFSLTLLLFFHLCPEWPTDSNGCTFKDGKKCQQFLKLQHRYIRKTGNIYPAKLKKLHVECIKSLSMKTQMIRNWITSNFSLILSWFIPVFQVDMINYLLYKLSVIFYTYTLVSFFHVSVN